MKELRKWFKNLNEKFNEPKVLFLVGFHFGLFVWLFRSVISIYDGEDVLTAFLNSILFGIIWAIPLCALGILLPLLRKEKTA